MREDEYLEADEIERDSRSNTHQIGLVQKAIKVDKRRLKIESN